MIKGTPVFILQGPQTTQDLRVISFFNPGIAIPIDKIFPPSQTGDRAKHGTGAAHSHLVEVHIGTVGEIKNTGHGKGKDVGTDGQGGKRGTAFVLVKCTKKDSILTSSLGTTPWSCSLDHAGDLELNHRKARRKRRCG